MTRCGRQAAVHLLAIATVLVGMSGTGASADTPGCVSRGEYAKVTEGMKKAKVHGIFDTKGGRVGISTDGSYEMRSYPACTQYGVVHVGYTDGKLSINADNF